MTSSYDEEAVMPQGMMGAVWAFGWGAAAASGVLAGAILGLTTHLRHRTIAAIMSLGAGVLLSVASIEIASEALMLAGAASTVAGIVAGAATFSIANAVLVTARDRKRCGECRQQPSEADAPGSGTSIALGTALDAVPEALVLGVTLRAARERAGGPCGDGRDAPCVTLIYLRAGSLERHRARYGGNDGRCLLLSQ
jgi:hypothetical protein